MPTRSHSQFNLHYAGEVAHLGSRGVHAGLQVFEAVAHPLQACSPTSKKAGKTSLCTTGAGCQLLQSSARALRTKSCILNTSSKTCDNICRRKAVDYVSDPFDLIHSRRNALRAWLQQLSAPGFVDVLRLVRIIIGVINDGIGRL